MNKTLTQHLKVISENSVDFISEKELAKKLSISFKEKKPLRVKIGFDPTACDIHLGHTVILKKLREIQDLGHIIYFIIGDFTACIGDPSGRSDLRPVLTAKEIEYNARTYTTQAFKILDEKKTKIVFNSQWYKKMQAQELIQLFSRYTVARMMERDDFSQRLKQNKPLTLQEFIYPIIQGYDSVEIEADVEFGGTDQKFNLIVARHLQESFGQQPQVVITLPLLVGLDGKNKMSKSLGNYIGITEDAKSMFGKLMSVSDELMWEYFRLISNHNLDKIKKMHPKEAKLLLAESLVSFYHSSETGKKEREEFDRVFSQKELPKEIPIYKTKKHLIDLVDILYKAKLISSKREGRRLLAQRGIGIQSKDGSIMTVSEQTIKIPPQGIILKIGKKRFLKITSQ